MANILVTGSTDGIGRETARALVALGHRVVLHARNRDRAAAALALVPDAAAILTGDLGSLAETRELAEAAASAGPFDAIIHNAGLGGGSAERTMTDDGIEAIFHVNVVAPYLLTALMGPPTRLVYLSSGLQADGRVDLGDLDHRSGPWNGMQAYSDSKLCDVVLAFAIARRWPTTLVNAVDPGWIRTRMGGTGAPGTLTEGADTPLWLATSDDGAALQTGRFFHRRQVVAANPVAHDPVVQDGLLAACAELTGVVLST